MNDIWKMGSLQSIPVKPQFVIDLNDLDGEAARAGAYLDYVVEKAAEARAQMYYYREQFIPAIKGQFLQAHRGQINPATGKAYTESDIDAIRHLAPSYLQAMEQSTAWVEKEAYFSGMVDLFKRRWDTINDVARRRASYIYPRTQTAIQDGRK